MLVKDTRRLVLFVLPTILLIGTVIRLYFNPEGLQKHNTNFAPSQFAKDAGDDQDPLFSGEVIPDDPQTTPEDIDIPQDIPQEIPQEAPQEAPQETLPDTLPETPLDPIPTPEQHGDNQPGILPLPEDLATTHQEVFSASTLDKKFFMIDFGNGFPSMNPNIIPHPTLDNTWIIVAQWRLENKESQWFAELVCDATFQDNVLKCVNPPTTLTVAATTGGGRCEGDLAFFNTNIGPHDARVFYGPEKPYTIFGSNSVHTCFGQFVQDLRMVVDWKGDRENLEFRLGTELQRPLPWNPVEKNWFLFWDSNGQLYAHYDVTPKRSFALVNGDGSVGPDLAPFSQESDERCMAKYFPKLGPKLESIHQATNSLQITTCNRNDPNCVPDESNTFLFTIIQHKTYFSYHSVYEPYVMVFKQQAPFDIHAISRQPIWIHGREKHPDKSTSDMFYVTSMSWKQRGQKYHGFLDDEIFLAFGIEDEKAAGINVLAGDLFKNLGACFEE
ncbi:hypothetical protein CEP51_008584 [Fusarium floridanum]|uniref:EH domain-containing protein n=1 Tax=Fusarium floridanum TaxID=1325733 RepID=A0A428RKE6_9HYPO|nr:hypothetical protein CEP51_008584 [Fusarium floridanum]